MAKVSKTLKATLTKNTLVEKGGAWLLTIYDDDTTHSAWSNPSAAKRYLKQYVIDNTPRKSLKLEVASTNDAGKPTHMVGEISYKVDA